EHIGSGRLLLQRLAQLVEQAGVLDSDDGLVGEVLDQLDLLVAERADLQAVDNDYANELSLLEHRDPKHRAIAKKLDAGDYAGITLYIGLVSGQGANMKDLFGLGDAGERDVWVIAQLDHRFSLQPFDDGRRTMHRDRTKGDFLAKI